MTSPYTVFTEPLPWSDDVSAWADRSLDSILSLYENNFYMDPKTDKVYMHRVWDLACSLRNQLYGSAVFTSNTTIGDLAFVLARCPKILHHLAMNANTDFYTHIVNMEEKEGYEFIREYSEPYSSLAWKLDYLLSGWNWNELYRDLSLEAFMGLAHSAGLSFDELQEFRRENRERKHVTPAMIKFGIDDELIDALIAGQVA